MKTMKDFEAYQLPKKQMNSLCGGALYRCVTSDGQGFLYQYNGTEKQMTAYFNSVHGSGSCSRIGD